MHSLLQLELEPLELAKGLLRQLDGLGRIEAETPAQAMDELTRLWVPKQKPSMGLPTDLIAYV